LGEELKRRRMEKEKSLEFSIFGDILLKSELRNSQGFFQFEHWGRSLRSFTFGLSRDCINVGLGDGMTGVSFVEFENDFFCFQTLVEEIFNFFSDIRFEFADSQSRRVIRD
jgi:hypothetical protein